MNDRTRRVPPMLQNFVKNLIDASATEIEKYTAEIMSNREFHKHLEENRKNSRGSPFSSWGPSIGTTLGTVLYTLCRKLKPDTVMETGVAGGVSSSYILCALEENKYGELHSIDLRWRGFRAYSNPDAVQEYNASVNQRESQSGWLIPDYLRRRWHLALGTSSEKLPPLLERLGTVDIFLHDSEHSYQNMLWEYQTAWVYLKSRGILLSHNVDINNAFSHFCRNINAEGYLLTNMGGIVKT